MKYAYVPTTFTVYSIHQNQLKFIQQHWVFCHLFNRTNRPENLMHFRTWPDRGSIEACSISHSEVQPHNLCMQQRAQSSASSWPIWTWTGTDGSELNCNCVLAPSCQTLYGLPPTPDPDLTKRQGQSFGLLNALSGSTLVLLVTWSDQAI